MADNYIERKFEEHYAPATSKVNKRKPIKPRNITITNVDSDLGTAIFENLRKLGHKLNQSENAEITICINGEIITVQKGSLINELNIAEIRSKNSSEVSNEEIAHVVRFLVDDKTNIKIF